MNRAWRAIYTVVGWNVTSVMAGCLTMMIVTGVIAIAQWVAALHMGSYRQDIEVLTFWWILGSIVQIAWSAIERAGSRSKENSE